MPQWESAIKPAATRNQCPEYGATLGKNGVLVASVTVGDKKIEIPADRIHLEFVLGNKVMVGTVNANREYFEMGVDHMAQAEMEYPDGSANFLPTPSRVWITTASYSRSSLLRMVL